MTIKNPDYFSFFGYEDSKLMPAISNLSWELSHDRYSPRVGLSEFAIRSYNSSSFGEEHIIQQHNNLREKLGKYKPIVPTFADTITLLSLGLGLWWVAGGPVWAGLLSILGDELDGRIARKMGTTSERGSNLDWGSDIALTAASLMRLGKNTGHLGLSIIAAPVFLLAQSHLRADGWRPPVGSARAVIMLSTMAIGKRV